MASDIFATTKRKQTEEDAKRQERQRLENLQLRSTPEDIFGVRPASKGRDASIEKIGERVPEVGPEGKRVREEAIVRERQAKEQAAIAEFAVSEAERVLRGVLPQLRTVSDEELAALNTAIAKRDTTAIGFLAKQIEPNARLAHPEEWSQVAEALRTIAVASVGKGEANSFVSRDPNTIPGISTFFPAFGGGNPVPTIGPSEAQASGLPVSQTLIERAQAGQPVFVGAGDQVGRLLGSDQAAGAVPGSPVMGGQAGGNGNGGGAIPTPKSPMDHIAEIAHGAMKFIGKGLSGISDPNAQARALGVGGTPPAGATSTPAPPAPAARFRVRDLRTGSKSATSARARVSTGRV